ncbi:MAG: AAA-like domain-containing protein, partial [Cyanobacteriota bacterium]
MPEGSPLRLFVSYSHKDENLRAALDDSLAGLQRDGVIDLWHDRKISAGQEWAGAIDANLEGADIVLCLVSVGFMASPYIKDIELKRALERHEAGEAWVIPVLLKPADWESSPLGRLQALPEGGKAVTKWTNRDEAFVSIAKGIREVAKRLAERPGRVARPAAPAPSGSLPPDPARPGPAVAAAPVAPAAALEIPEGPVRHDSAFYIHPADEARCTAELDKPGALIRSKSPKGFGKSSLTARLLAYASGKGYRTASLNLEGTDQKFFADPELFMQWFCASVGKELGVRVRKEEYWEDYLGANDNSSDYFETYLLKPD